VKFLKKNYIIFILVSIILTAAFSLPINTVRAQVQNISITKLVDEPSYKKTLFVITTTEKTYHILVIANITTNQTETLVNLTASLINPHNASINALASIPDWLYDAPYYDGPVEAFHIWLPDWAVTALKIALPVVVIVAIVGQVYMIIEDIVSDVSGEILDMLMSNDFVWASLPWIFLTLLTHDTNPDGSFDLYIPFRPFLLHFQLILAGHYYIATSFSWWEIVKCIACLPWPFNWICWEYFVARWVCSRMVPPPEQIPPQASFEYYPSIPTIDEEITFISTSFDPDGFISECKWDFGDGTAIAYGCNVTHVYTEVGEYNVTLSIKDNSGLVDVVSHVIRVQPKPEAKLRVIPTHLRVEVPTGRNATAKFVVKESLNQTDLENVVFMATDFKNPVGDTLPSQTVFFDKNNITVPKGGYANITTTFHAPEFLPVGLYYGNITVTSRNGGNATIYVTVYIFGPPYVNFTWTPKIAKVNEEVIFDASSSLPYKGSITRYEWNFGDGSSGLGQIVAHKYSTPGIYTVTLNVTDSNDLWAIAQAQIQVVQPYGPTANFTAIPEKPKVGQAVLFNASDSLPGWNGTHTMPIKEYRWNFGDGNKTTTTSPIVYHAYQESGIYYVTLTVYAPGATPETDSITRKIIVPVITVGGKCYPIEIPKITTAKPTEFYTTTILAISSILAMIIKKTSKKK